jgi:hypothetical protein
VVVVVQVVAQALGAYWLLMEAEEHNNIAKSLSLSVVRLGIWFDTAEIYVFGYLIYFHNMTVLVFPTYLLFMLVVFLEPFLLAKIEAASLSDYPDPEVERTQNWQAFRNEEHQPVLGKIYSILNNPNIKFILSIAQRNRNYLMCGCSFLVFYINNMQNYIYLIYFLVFLFPQIGRNCLSGSTVNYSIESVLMYAYPRLIPILYTRFLGINSLFIFQPCYLFCVVIISCSLGSSALLLIQKKCGARSILPKFLIPKGLKKFKFFVIQD